MKADAHIVRLRDALSGSGDQREHLTLAVKTLKSEGLKQEDAVAALTLLRAEFKGTNTEETILEVLDFVVGWCSPQNRIWEPSGN